MSGCVTRVAGVGLYQEIQYIFRSWDPRMNGQMFILRLWVKPRSHNFSGMRIHSYMYRDMKDTILCRYRIRFDFSELITGE